MKLKILKTKDGVKIQCLRCKAWVPYNRVPEQVECVCGKVFSVFPYKSGG